LFGIYDIIGFAEVQYNKVELLKMMEQYSTSIFYLNVALQQNNDTNFDLHNINLRKGGEIERLSSILIQLMWNGWRSSLQVCYTCVFDYLFFKFTVTFECSV
jgi:hypothetical protein